MQRIALGRSLIPACDLGMIDYWNWSEARAVYRRY